ncbi:hypothetical protein [Isoptericola sp. NPDC055881]
MKQMKHLRMVPIATVRPSNNNHQEQVMSPLPQHAIVIVALVLSIAFYLVVTVTLSHHLPSGVDPELFITTTLDLLKPSGTETPPPVMGGAALPFSAA